MDGHVITYSTIQKRVRWEVEGKSRELFINGNCSTWFGVLIFHEINSEGIEQHFVCSGGCCEKHEKMLKIIKRREGICHL
jgi:hypothetical protein